ncbi:hypothetical protein [Bacillus sp. 2205SS5-2]|uniref:hypothetical protein n=1 Tax=Bacillus sp. 2205SS5-2 TaxID=3109031 RepID=UPI00300611A5
MYNKIKVFIPIILLFLTLTGCRVVFYDESLQSQPLNSKKSEEVTLEGTVFIERARLIIRGTTNLPKGTIILAGLKEFSKNATITDIFEGNEQVSGDFVEEYKVEVDDTGQFTIVINKKQATMSSQLEVWFRPNLQINTLQEKFGRTGEFLAEVEGLENYEFEGESFSGLVKYAPILDGGGKWKLAPSLTLSRPM